MARGQTLSKRRNRALIHSVAVQNDNIRRKKKQKSGKVKTLSEVSSANLQARTGSRKPIKAGTLSQLNSKDKPDGDVSMSGNLDNVDDAGGTGGRGKISKHRFFLDLFSQYNKFPLESSLTNFAKVYGDVFINELPSALSSYSLYDMQIVEVANIGQPCGEETFSMPFRYNFTNNTTKFVDYVGSAEYVKAVKGLCRSVKLHDNADEFLELQKRGMRYEPF